MSYLNLFLIGMVVGLLLNVIFSFISRKRRTEEVYWKEVNIENERDYATKEDILKLQMEIEEMKKTHKDTEEILKAEKEFYESTLLEDDKLI